MSLSMALLADARVRLGLPESHLEPGIRPVAAFSRMVGRAVTVRLEVARDKDSADLALMRQAYESGADSFGSIIVIQVPVELHRYGIVGEGAATWARQRGFVGALVEGAARDTYELREMEFPVFSRVVSPGYIVGKASAVALAGPVLVGGRTIHEGDVIVADNDGVIVIRPAELDDVAARALAIKEWEGRVLAMLADGGTHEDAVQAAGPMP